MASTGAEVTSGTQYINYFLSTILLSLRPIKVFIIKQPHRCLSGSLSGSLWPPSKKELAPQPPLLKLLPRSLRFGTRSELGLRNETPREHYAGSLADPAETDAKWFLLTE